MSCPKERPTSVGWPIACLGEVLYLRLLSLIWNVQLVQIT